jgi:hypothetical protein
MVLESKKDKGRCGLSLAIAYFGSNGYTVSIPLNDTQDYDLIIDKDDILSRVSVKFTGRKCEENYTVDLRSCGGSNGAKVYSNFIDSNASLLFVVTEEPKLYLIPKEKVNTTTQITLSGLYDDCIVTI